MKNTVVIIMRNVIVMAVFISKNLFAFLENKWYNKITKLNLFRKKKNESNEKG